MPQSLSGAEMRKRQQAHIEGPPRAPGPPRPSTCCLCWCGCCKCLWYVPVFSSSGGKKKEEVNEDRRERPDQQTCTNMDTIESTEEQVPSLDEVVAWSRSFELMMRSAEGRDIFREFLQSEYSEENLMFWIACEELKKETNPSAIEEKARIIYEDYVSILSPKEVSLDSRVRESINRSLLEPNRLMYEEAQLQIYTLMHRDSFPRFLNSSVYRHLLEKTRGCLDT